MRFPAWHPTDTVMTFTKSELLILTSQKKGNLMPNVHMELQGPLILHAFLPMPHAPFSAMRHADTRLGQALNTLNLLQPLEECYHCPCSPLCHAAC